MPDVSPHHLDPLPLARPAWRGQVSHARVWLPLSLLLPWLIAPTTTYAGNDDQVLIGTQGAQAAGAVTASVSDATALWYNPAAIGRTRWAQFGLNASLVQLRITHADRLLAADSGPRRGATLVETNTLPSTLAHEIPLPHGMAFAYGAFASQGSNETLRTDLTGLTDNELNELHIALTSARTLYHFGGGLGIPLGRRVRVGVAVFGVYEEQHESTAFAAGANLPDRGGLLLTDTAERSGVAGQINLGVQWSPNANWDVGLSLIAPRILLATTRDELSASTYVDLDGNASHSVLDEGGFETPLEVSAPTRVRGGVAHHAGKLTMMLDADFQTGLRNRILNIDRRFTPNARVAFSYGLDGGASIGAGLFTDLAPDSRADRRTNFYGIAGGVATMTRFGLSDDEPSDMIEFSSFIGFRYAIGIGVDQAGGLQIHDVSAGLPFSALKTDIYVHEIGLNIGSGLRF